MTFEGENFLEKMKDCLPDSELSVYIENGLPPCHLQDPRLLFRRQTPESHVRNGGQDLEVQLDWFDLRGNFQGHWRIC